MRVGEGRGLGGGGGGGLRTCCRCSLCCVAFSCRLRSSSSACKVRLRDQWAAARAQRTLSWWPRPTTLLSSLQSIDPRALELRPPLDFSFCGQCRTLLLRRMRNRRTNFSLCLRRRRLLRCSELHKVTMRHVNSLGCPQLAHEVAGSAGGPCLAEWAHRLVFKPRKQALSVEDVTTCGDAARAFELVSANRAARAHVGPSERALPVELWIEGGNNSRVAFLLKPEPAARPALTPRRTPPRARPCEPAATSQASTRRRRTRSAPRQSLGRVARPPRWRARRAPSHS